jgi:ribosome-binding factor A
VVKDHSPTPGPRPLTPVFMRRPEKVADLLREEITQIVGYELADPRVMMVTVTDVRVSDNLKNARVFVIVEGDEDEKQAALTALRKAALYVRKQLELSLSLRHAPEIHFVRDTIEERGARVDQLLAEIEHDWETQGSTENAQEERKDEG